jgi:hypothetical protein
MIYWWTHLPSSITNMSAHTFNTPTKATESSCTPSCCICQYSSNAYCPWTHFTCPNIMVVQVTTFWCGILLNIIQASSMLSHFAYMCTKLLPTKISNSKPLWMIYWWTLVPSSIVIMSAYAFNTPTKVTELGCITCYYICWNRSSACYPWPHCTCPNIMAI